MIRVLGVAAYGPLSHFAISCGLSVIAVIAFGRVDIDFVLAVAGAFFVREVEHDWRNGRRPVWPFRWSRQNTFDFIAGALPVMIGAALA